jgi:hypothetical protein
MLSFTSALSVSGVPSNVTLITGDTITLNLNFTNSHVYTIYDLETDNEYVTLPEDISIPAQTTQSIPLTIHVDDTGTFDTTVEVKAYKRVNCSVVSQTEPHDINIYGTGSNPANLYICKNEKVEFINKYESWIKLRIYPDTVWGSQITTNSSYIRDFTSIGNFPYEVYPLIPGGNIEVSDGEVSVHSSDDDTSFTLHIVSKLEDTTLSIQSISQTDFTLDYDGSDSGFLIIKNTGSKKAVGVTLSADWIAFDKNNFDLSSGSSQAVNFVVSPYITDDSETNKTHTKTIKVSSSNSADVNQNVNIFINYASGFDEGITTEAWWNAKKAFCTSFPTSPYCATEPVIVYQKVPEYDCPDILANMSAEDVQEILREGLKAYDAAHSTFNFMKTQSDNNSVAIDQIFHDQNETKTEMQKIRESIDDLGSIFFVVVFGLLFMIIFIVFFYVMYKKIQKKKRMRGEY